MRHPIKNVCIFWQPLMNLLLGLEEVFALEMPIWARAMTGLLEYEWILCENNEKATEVMRRYSRKKYIIVEFFIEAP